MQFQYSEQEEKFRQYVVQFIKENSTRELIDEFHINEKGGPHYAAFKLKMAEAGLLGLSWPKEYGGKEMPLIYDAIVNAELSLAGAPPVSRVIGVGRTLMHHGSEHLKREILPHVLKGEIEFVIGYTEPEAGSDLASLQLRATEDGDYYVLNGQKTFQTSAHCVEYAWLLARTDPDLPKHRGVSLFLVDLKTPGITMQPIHTMGGQRTNDVYYDDVRVPKHNMVGERNRGFYYVMEALVYERYLSFSVNILQAEFDQLLNWVREAELGGVRLSKDPLVRQKVARLAIEMETARAIETNVHDAVQNGRSAEVEASMNKHYASQLGQRIGDFAANMMGAYGQLKTGSKHAQAAGEMERLMRASVIWTIAGGSSEIQKNIIAKRGLGLPG